MSICDYICLSVCLPACLSACLSVCLSVHEHVLKLGGGMQMLGEAFKAEVAANGGKLPPLGIKSLMRLAGRLWVKRKIFHGKQKLGGLFGIQVSLLPKPFLSPSCWSFHRGDLVYI